MYRAVKITHKIPAIPYYFSYPRVLYLSQNTPAIPEYSSYPTKPHLSHNAPVSLPASRFQGSLTVHNLIQFVHLINVLPQISFTLPLLIRLLEKTKDNTPDKVLNKKLVLIQLTSRIFYWFKMYLAPKVFRASARYGLLQPFTSLQVFTKHIHKFASVY